MVTLFCYFYGGNLMINNDILNLDEERIDFLIDLLINFMKTSDNENDYLLAKEFYTDLSIMTLED
jgi:hypothetical protein